MEYQEFTDYISTLDFVPNREAGDLLIKAVLGLLCSSVDEQAARMLCNRLPDPLTLEDLRGYQPRIKSFRWMHLSGRSPASST